MTALSPAATHVLSGRNPGEVGHIDARKGSDSAGLEYHRGSKIGSYPEVMPKNVGRIHKCFPRHQRRNLPPTLMMNKSQIGRVPIGSAIMKT
jgi:hypothetical protein